MGKKFMGLDGTDHFWDRAKAWILDQITSAGIDKQSIIDAVYPVGSLYWSSKDTDPSTLFGGTWVQIKDKFVLACGDTYTSVGATGGASTVTLSVSNMPSHNHTFTPSGTITMNSHSHGLNNHTHSFSKTATTTSTVTDAKESTTSKNLTGFIPLAFTAGTTGTANGIIQNPSSSNIVKIMGADISTGYNACNINATHQHRFTVSGTTGGNSENTTPTTSTGSFTGTAGTTGSNGSGTAFSILPPYVVKYCWERTA